MNCVYRIWYGDEIVYVGRTVQPLGDRIHDHVFSKHKRVPINLQYVSRVDFHQFATEGDMYMYEIYLICKLRPRLNVDDKPKDGTCFVLPELGWTAFPLIHKEKWLTQIADRKRFF